MEQILNDEQLAAVTSTEGYARVIAGAGFERTRSLTLLDFDKASFE